MCWGGGREGGSNKVELWSISYSAKDEINLVPNSNGTIHLIRHEGKGNYKTILISWKNKEFKRYPSRITLPTRLPYTMNPKPLKQNYITYITHIVSSITNSNIR